MNVLFLDIDGVLTSDDYENTELYGLNKKCLTNLKKIVNFFDNLKIVITSTWRKSNVRIEKLKKIFRMYQISDLNVDMTPIHDKNNLFEEIRKNEINEWLKKNQVIKWIIIDDWELNMNNFYKINPETGLSYNDSKKIISILYNE